MIIDRLSKETDSRIYTWSLALCKGVNDVVDLKN